MLWWVCGYFDPEGFKYAHSHESPVLYRLKIRYFYCNQTERLPSDHDQVAAPTVEWAIFGRMKNPARHTKLLGDSYCLVRKRMILLAAK